MAKTITFTVSNAQFTRALAAITASSEFKLAQHNDPTLTVQSFTTGLMWEVIRRLVKSTENRLATQAALAALPPAADVPVDIVVT